MKRDWIGDPEVTESWHALTIEQDYRWGEGGAADGWRRFQVSVRENGDLEFGGTPEIPVHWAPILTEWLARFVTDQQVTS